MSAWAFDTDAGGFSPTVGGLMELAPLVYSLSTM
jgi:hypothetical protein